MKETIQRYEKMLNNDKEGVVPLHRDEMWKKNERENAKDREKDNWYRGGKDKFEAPLFIPWTENGELKNVSQKIVDDLGLKIKVVEKTGRKIKELLQKSSIGVNKRCPSGCVVCGHDNKLSCLTTDITYKINCPMCGRALKPLKAEYNGETSRTAKTRATEHMEKLRKRDEESVLWQHAKTYHGGEIPEYEFTITGSYLKRPLQRQLMEAVLIEQSDADIIMNNKNEWMLPMSINVRIERGAANV